MKLKDELLAAQVQIRQLKEQLAIQDMVREGARVELNRLRDEVALLRAKLLQPHPEMRSIGKEIPPFSSPQEEIKSLKEELGLYNAKLEMLGTYVETEEGIFTFPDGDYVYTKKKEPTPPAEKKRLPSSSA